MKLTTVALLLLTQTVQRTCPAPCNSVPSSFAHQKAQSLMYSLPPKIALDLWSVVFLLLSYETISSRSRGTVVVAFTALSTQAGTHSILSRSLLSDCPIHFFILLLPLPQFLPLFNIYPAIAAVFLKPPQLLSCTRWGTNIHMRKRRQNKESMGASVTQAAYVTNVALLTFLTPSQR